MSYSRSEPVFYHNNNNKKNRVIFKHVAATSIANICLCSLFLSPFDNGKTKFFCTSQLKYKYHWTNATSLGLASGKPLQRCRLLLPAGVPLKWGLRGRRAVRRNHRQKPQIWILFPRVFTRCLATGRSANDSSAQAPLSQVRFQCNKKKKRKQVSRVALMKAPASLKSEQASLVASR